MDQLSAFVEAFEAAQANGPAELTQFLPDPVHPLYGDALRELVRVDLEYGWQRGRPTPLDHYRARFPELFAAGGAAQELAFEEYRLRLQAGEGARPEEYEDRYGVCTRGWPRPQAGAAPAGLLSIAATGSAHTPRGGDGLRHAGQEWDVLDRLLRQLQTGGRDDEQVALVLEAVRDALGADVVFSWDEDGAGPAVQRAGAEPLSPAWCAELARASLADQAGASHALLPRVRAVIAGGGPFAHSVAMVRVGKRSPAWVVAVSLNAARRLGAADVKVIRLARRMLAAQRQHARTCETLKDTLFSLIRCLTTTIDARDPYTCGHSERVARIAVRLGRQLGCPTRVLSDLYLAGLLHDVGKIGVNDRVLLKPGRLTDDELAHVREHVLIGDRIVSTVRQLAPLRDGVRSHHERYDGTGYPDRLAGKDIPLVARVLAVADACDAMMSPRPYRAALPARRLEAVMADGAGTQWDPEIIGHFMSCRQELYSICQRGIGNSVRVAVEHALQPGTGASSAATAGVAEGA